MSAAAAGAPAPRDLAPAPTARRLRGWGVPLAATLAAFVLLAGLGGALGQQPGGPASSSYATGEGGVAALAALLAREGRPVSQLRAPLDHAPLDPGATVFLLAPDALLHSDGTRLLRFVRAGGRLVFGGGDVPATLPALLASGPSWTGSGSERYTPASPSARARLRLDVVRSAGAGSWTQSGGFEAPLRDTAGRALLLEQRMGSGTLLLLADDSPVQNRLLGEAGNARLGVDLAGAGGRPAVFVESVHGFGVSRGIAALPHRWLLALAGLALAGMLWAAGRARRLGPPERPARPLAPPRSAYAQALALLLRRTGDPAAITKKLQEMRSYE